MLYKFLKLSVFSTLLISSFVSCSGELHREGKLLYYTVDNSKLYVIYQNDDQNKLFLSGLSPLNVEWEKKISGHPVEPALFILDDYVLCNCKKGQVCLLNNSTGNTAASVDSNLVVTKQSIGFAVNEGMFYTYCNSNSICGYSIEKNKNLWEHQLKDDERITIQFQVEASFLIYGNNSGKIVAINTVTGKKMWETDALETLDRIYAFPETVVGDYDKIDGFDISTGTVKWIAPHQGKVRCVMDGLLVAQSDDFFSVLFTENGEETWSYPRTGTTFLNCQESLSFAAFTVKNLENADEELEDAEDYFDKVYIFNAATGERIFDYNSSEEMRVLNMTGFMTDRFHLAFETEKETHDEITVKMFSSVDFSEQQNYIFSNDSTNEELYVAWMHTDVNYTVFRLSTITGTLIETNFLFRTETGELLGRMESYPEIITGTNAYDIISYDDYFNIFEKTLPDFLIYD